MPPGPCKLRTRTPRAPQPDAVAQKSAVHCEPAFLQPPRERAAGPCQEKAAAWLRIALFMEDILGRNNVPARGIVGTGHFGDSGSEELRGRPGRYPAPPENRP